MAFVDDSRDLTLRGSEARVGDYLALLKPRVMSLVVFTAFVGMIAAPGGLHPFVALVAIGAIAVGAGASAALNMWYDSDIDAVMTRTRNRPIPAGKLTREDALAVGLTLSAFSVAVLGLATNWAAAGLLAFTIFFYAVVYTMWLKRSTPQNIVIGGAAGAFPPMVGWAAVTGSTSIDAIALFLVIFLWTPPHFWALALFKQSDYQAAGVPMMPNVAGDRATRNQIVLLYGGAGARLVHSDHDGAGRADLCTAGRAARHCLHRACRSGSTLPMASKCARRRAICSFSP